MSVEFPRPPESIELHGGKRRQLTQNFTMYIDGVIAEIPKGFIWDGASIPKFARWKFGEPFDAIHFIPGLFHDGAHAGFIDISRLKADVEYAIMIHKNGQTTKKSILEFLAVRIFGKKHWLV